MNDRDRHKLAALIGNEKRLTRAHSTAHQRRIHENRFAAMALVWDVLVPETFWRNYLKRNPPPT